MKKLYLGLLVAAIALLLGAGTSRAAPAGSPWNASYFTNVVLTDQDGNKLRFYDDMLKDKVVLINFIYATCHDACPLETAKLRQVQERLAGHVGRDMFMYSISITPEIDTPQVLKEYSEKFHVGPGWKFLTGNADDILMLRKKLGLYSDEATEKEEGHGMSLVVGNDRTGVWLKRSSFDNPKVLARVMSDRLLNFRQARADAPSYAETATKIVLDPGEDLFRRRCQDCHTVGAGDAIGPDLAGVSERRERAWLAKFIQDPNAMIEAKDPIATALFIKHKKLPMPRLGLNDHDVAVLIEYIDRQTGKIKAADSASATIAQDAQAQGNDHEHAHDHAHMHSH
ncbi:MAG TPA: SCO family protein [Usitatibacter sp.]|nr:SCO family protein [Usitatibacter sp.]